MKRKSWIIKVKNLKICEGENLYYLGWLNNSRRASEMNDCDDDDDDNDDNDNFKFINNNIQYNTYVIIRARLVSH